MSTHDPNSPQLLALVSTEEEAASIIDYLDGLGIQAGILAAGDFDGPVLIQIRVLPADFAKAKAALARLRQPARVESDGAAGP